MKELFLREHLGYKHITTKKQNKIDVLETIREQGLRDVMRAENSFNEVDDEITIYYDNYRLVDITESQAKIKLLEALIQKGYNVSKDLQSRFEFYKQKLIEIEAKKEAKRQKERELYEAKKQEERKKQEEESKYEYRYYCPMLGCEITPESCKKWCPQKSYNQGCTPKKVKLLKEV